MRANEAATTQATPLALIATGACSRELPQPKFSSATMMSPGSTRSTNPASMSSMQWLPSSAGSLVLR